MKERKTAEDIIIENIVTGFRVLEPILPSRSAIKDIFVREVAIPIFQRCRKTIQRRRCR